MTRFSLAAACCLAAAAPQSADANPDRISILLGSYHVDAQRDFQEINPGVFFSWDIDRYPRLSYSVGAYYNSYKNVSALASIGYNYPVTSDFSLGAFAALAVYPGDGDEFSHSFGDVVPLAGLQARYKNVFVQFIPADGDALDALFTVGLTFPLD